ncbi:MAG: DUF1294 domain-containing protein [Fuerstiella sp.]
MKTLNLRKTWLFLAFVWLLGCAGLLAASLLSDAFTPGLWAELYFVSVTLFSPLALAAFAWDKWKAERDGRRISEKALHFLAFLGGWPGAVIGQQWFRHKTLKPVFRTILFVIVALHLGLSALLVYRHLAGA